MKYRQRRTEAGGGRSLPARGVWIEILTQKKLVIGSVKSLPARGVWIEMPVNLLNLVQMIVTPRTGSVD